MHCVRLAAIVLTLSSLLACEITPVDGDIEETRLENGEPCETDADCISGLCFNLLSSADLTIIDQRCAPADCGNHYVEGQEEVQEVAEACQVFE